MTRLSIEDHDRGAAGMVYVYAVVSRRSRGLSIGINLNTNNACNWRCVYCQVPGLSVGKAPPVDLRRLEQELEALLQQILHGDFLEQRVPTDARRLNDVAFSGNGEPSASPNFTEAVEVVIAALHTHELLGRVKPLLITNGSLVHTRRVQAALARLAEHGGEIWFKLDSATQAGQLSINSAGTSVERQLENLRVAAGLCPTWVQTIALARGGVPPAEPEQAAYLAALARLKCEGVPLRGVLLYGLARLSRQPEAGELAALPVAWLEAYARRIETIGYPVQVHP